MAQRKKCLQHSEKYKLINYLKILEINTYFHLIELYVLRDFLYFCFVTYWAVYHSNTKTDFQKQVIARNSCINRNSTNCVICIVANDNVKFSRASNKPEKPGVIPSKRDDPSLSTSHQPVKKLEDNRRLMLEQQLGENQQPTISPLYQTVSLHRQIYIYYFTNERFVKCLKRRRTRQKAVDRPGTPSVIRLATFLATDSILFYLFVIRPPTREFFLSVSSLQM